MKANRARAIQLHGASASGKRGQAGLAGDQARQAGFASLDDYQALMGATQRRLQITHLQQETAELIDVIASARPRSDDIRSSTSLSLAARIERQELLANMAARPDAARTALARHIERCDELSAAIASHGKRQERLSALGEHDIHATAELEKLTGRLARAQELRDVALGLQAPAAADAVLPGLRQLAEALGQLADHADRELARARTASRAAQQAEIGQSLASLQGLDVRYNREAARSFVRTRLDQCIGKECDVGAHAIPAPLLVDIYIGALGRTSRPPQKLDDAAHARALEIIAALPGGMLACEQITGIKLGKQQRIANRVEALANTTRARLSAAGQTGGAASARLVLLEQAAQAASRVKASGSFDGCCAPVVARCVTASPRSSRTTPVWTPS